MKQTTTREIIRLEKERQNKIYLENRKVEVKNAFTYIENFIKRNQNPKRKITTAFVVQVCREAWFQPKYFLKLNKKLGNIFKHDVDCEIEYSINAPGAAYRPSKELLALLYCARILYEYAKKLRKNKII